MLTAIVILIILASLVLWLVILVQNPKGGGISSQFGGSSVTNIIGAKQSVDVVEKTTWIVGIVVLVLVVLSSSFITPSEGDFGPGISGGDDISTESLNQPPPQEGDPSQGGGTPPEGQPQGGEEQPEVPAN